MSRHMAGQGSHSHQVAASSVGHSVAHSRFGRNPRTSAPRGCELGGPSEGRSLAQKSPGAGESSLVPGVDVIVDSAAGGPAMVSTDSSFCPLCFESCHFHRTCNFGISWIDLFLLEL